MDIHLEVADGLRLAVCEASGALLAEKGDIKPFLEAAWGLDAVPTSRLGPDFLDLRTGLLGETTQTFVTYRTGLAVIGDIESAMEASRALRDYVRETRRGGGVRFARDLPHLVAQLTERPYPSARA